MEILLLAVISVLFIMTFYWYMRKYEGFTGGSDGRVRCPNLLIQQGSKFYLYNSNLAKVPGVNPIEFDSLENYVEFLEWQRGAGIRCPVLYLQYSYDAQGKPVYKVRNSVTDPRGGLPPNPGVLTDLRMLTSPLGVMEDNGDAYDNNGISDDAMDTNWGGPEYTQALVDAGYYKGNEVSIKVA